jgi:hypothetical protein
MKTILKLAVAAIALTAFTAQAQLGAPQVVVRSAVSSGAYAAITNNTIAYPTNAIVEAPTQKDAAIAFTSELSGAGTTANTVVIQESVDRSNWETILTFTATPAGTTPVTVVTNLPIGALPYLRVYSIANANANTGYITNYTVKVRVK